MMARALLVHWLTSPASFGGHPSSVVLLRSASSCVENQGGLYYCLAHDGDGNIPFGEIGRAVNTSAWYKKSWACNSGQVVGFIFLHSTGALIHSVLHGITYNTSATCFCDISYLGEKVHVTFGHECQYVRCVPVILYRNSNGFHSGECCSPSEAKWESGEII